MRCSFLHCGDIHLGHMPYNEYERMLDFAAAFRQVTRYALAEKVDFLLISGDFFHKRAINAEVLAQAVELLIPLKEAGLPVIAIEGNHDKAFYQDKNSWLWFLNTQGYLKLLRPHFQEGILRMAPWEEDAREGALLDLPQARIYGAGYLGVTTASRLEEVYSCLEKEGEKPLILMLHGAVNRLMGQDLGGIKKEALDPLREKVDYLALGHIHNRYELDDWIYNPGSLECVHLDEYGEGREKGFYHVVLEEGKREVRYIPSRYRPVACYAVDVTGAQVPEDVYAKVKGELAKNTPPEKGQLRVTLQGSIAFNPVQLDLNSLAADVKGEYGLLYLEFLNNINLPREINLQEGFALSREDIEDLVYSQLLEAEGLKAGGQVREATQALRIFKEMILTGEPEEEILEFLVKGSLRIQAWNEAEEEAALALEEGELS